MGLPSGLDAVAAGTTVAAATPRQAARHRETGMSIRHTTDEAFQRDVLEADGPVLVDFWAELKMSLVV